MSIKYKKQKAVLSGVVVGDDAEALLEWLQQTPSARVDLSTCTHLHPANLQVLMASRASVSFWPVDNELATWLKSALNAPGEPRDVRAAGKGT